MVSALDQKLARYFHCNVLIGKIPFGILTTTNYLFSRFSEDSSNRDSDVTGTVHVDTDLYRR
jgi:hypothetical protein